MRWGRELLLWTRGAKTPGHPLRACEGHASESNSCTGHPGGCGVCPPSPSPDWLIGVSGALILPLFTCATAWAKHIPMQRGCGGERQLREGDPGSCWQVQGNGTISKGHGWVLAASAELL